MTETEHPVIAVSAEEVEKFGCPYCGHKPLKSCDSTGDTWDCQCLNCRREYFVLFNGVQQSSIPFNNKYTPVQPHPRKTLDDLDRPELKTF